MVLPAAALALPLVSPDTSVQSGCADTFGKNGSLYVYKQHMHCRARAPLQVPWMHVLVTKDIG